MDVEITVKFIIKDACDQNYVNHANGDTDEERLSNVIHELVNDEGLMSVVQYPADEILEIKKRV